MHSTLKLFSLSLFFAMAQALAGAETPAETLKKKARTPVEIEYPSFVLMFDPDKMENQQLWDRGEFEAFDARKEEAAKRYVSWIRALDAKTTVRVGRSKSPDFPDGSYYETTPRDWVALAATKSEFTEVMWQWAMDCQAYHDLVRALDRYQKQLPAPDPVVTKALAAIRRLEGRRTADPNDLAAVRALLPLL